MRVTGLLAFSVLLFAAAVHAESAQIESTFDISGRSILDGKNVRVSVGHKKGVVILFLSAKCPCSNSHVDEIINLAKNYPDFNFIAVHSNSNESEGISKAYFESKKLPFPVIEDDRTQLADRFKALKTPHAFVVDPGGKIVYQGGISNSADFARSSEKYLRDALDDLKSNRAVKVSNGRTLGCVIQRG